MNKKIKYLIFGLLALTVVNASYAQSLSNAQKKAIGSFDITKNFKGFSYEMEGQDFSQVSVRIPSKAFKGKEFAGITLILSEEGDINSIKPLFQPKKDYFDINVWALGEFKKNNISIDALWEIARCSIPKDAKDVHILAFLIATIQNTEGYPDIASVLIRTDGALMKSLKKIAAASGREIEVGNLAELQEWIEAE